MRKRKTLVIAAEGRDKGKAFVLCEMPARQAEAWGIRMMEALGRSGVAVPDGVAQGGLAGLASLGFRALLGAPWALTGPLLDEMFEACVSYQPSPKVLRGAGLPETPAVGPLIDDDTEEIATRLLLRSEVFELHTGFSVAAWLSRLWERSQAALAAASSITPTSEGSAARSSPGASQDS